MICCTRLELTYFHSLVCNDTFRHATIQLIDFMVIDSHLFKIKKTEEEKEEKEEEEEEDMAN